MPELSRFYGIIITINFGDHPPPHFHIRYNSFKALMSIESGALLFGNLPPKAHALVIEWFNLNKKELQLAWQEASQNRLPQKIKPLE